MDISVVSPVYKAKKMVDILVAQLIETLSKITNDFEILLIDDGSPDNSWESIIESSKKDSRVKGIRLSRNFGQHNAITAGLDTCKGEWVVIIDCDLQDNPEEIIKLYNKAKEGFDVVLARRGKRKDSLIKVFQNWLFYKVFNYLTDMNCDSEVGAFRILSRKVVENLKQIREENRYIHGLVQWTGFSTASIDVIHGKRTEGSSTYTLGKMIHLAIGTIISYSDKPLRVVTMLGFSLSFIAFVYGTYILLRAIFLGSPVTGWTSLFVSLYFLSGVIITILGIIGIYLGKTFSEVKKRPLYVISSQIGL